MPMLNREDRREREQATDFQQERTPDTPFNIAFSASVGQVFDEALSISGGLNREAWTERSQIVRELIDSGEVDREKYLVRRGRGYKFDYEALARDHERVRSDEDMEEERNEILRKRREMADDELSRASGLAQFTGAMTGYMLDPISIATLPISTSATTAKSLGIMGRALLTARNAAVVEMGAEMAIQPFVFQHKMDIDSPYSQEDALLAIGSAALGAGAIGGVTGGVSGYLKSVRERMADIPGTKDTDKAAEYLARVEETLKDNPHRKEGMTHEQMVNADKQFLSELEVQRKVSGSPNRKPEDFAEPERPKPQRSETGNRESEILERTGMKDDFDADMQAYREKKGVETRPLHELKQDFGDIKLKETVRVKQTGKTKKVDVDANTLWRQTVKRRSVGQRLENCLNA